MTKNLKIKKWKLIVNMNRIKIIDVVKITKIVKKLKKEIKINTTNAKMKKKMKVIMKNINMIIVDKSNIWKKIMHIYMNIDMNMKKVVINKTKRNIQIIMNAITIIIMEIKKEIIINMFMWMNL